MKRDQDAAGGMAQPILTPGRNWLGAFWTFVRTRLVADTPALSHAESAR